MKYGVYVCTVLRGSKSSLSGLIYKLHLVTSTAEPDNSETSCHARDYVLEFVWCTLREGRKREKGKTGSSCPWDQI